MIRAQKESIDTLKQMLSQLLREKKKPKGKTLSYKSKGKRKEKESSSSANIESRGGNWAMPVQTQPGHGGLGAGSYPARPTRPIGEQPGPARVP